VLGQVRASQGGPELVVRVLVEGVQVEPHRAAEQSGVLVCVINSAEKGESQEMSGGVIKEGKWLVTVSTWKQKKCSIISRTCGTMATLLRSVCSEMLSTLVPSMNSSPPLGSTILQRRCTCKKCSASDHSDNIGAARLLLLSSHSNSAYLNSAAMREDLPAPVRPTTPSFVRPGIVNDTSLHANE